jgi:D-aminopeptidase
VTPSIRARDLGVPFDGRPGSLNAITDIAGFEVGMVTRERENTGITALLPRGRDRIAIACAAGRHVLNGNGEMTGSAWIDERGAVDLPILLTGTPSVGVCHTGVVRWVTETHPKLAEQWLLPVVCETWDGYLSDPSVQHLTPADAAEAIATARGGAVTEGSTGGGTGMSAYGFKAGSGTASRIVDHGSDRYIVGVFVQANFGASNELTIAGVPGRQLLDAVARDENEVPFGAGSVIAVVATDAPLLPNQCEALARRVPLGLARTGTTGSHFSGDLFLALSTANADALSSRVDLDTTYESLRFIPWGQLDPLFAATVQAVEEAVLNALVAGRDTVGWQGRRSPGLPHEAVRALLAAHGRH